jgi:tRNA A-37 threonylcarbamoyl transferase component Bud32
MEGSPQTPDPAEKKVRPKTVFASTLSERFFINIYEQSEPLENTEEVILEEKFFMAFTSKKDILRRYVVELRGNYLFFKMDTERAAVAIANLTNLHMRIIPKKLIAGKKLWTLRFTKNRIVEELYTGEEKVVRRWYEQLKGCCVQSRFNSVYTCLKVLGKGNFAKVYLIERKADGKRFAAKVFDKRLILAEESEQKSLLYEIKMLKTVKHPNCLGLVELYEGENFVYCVCNLYTGGNLLNKVLSHKYFPEPQAVEYLKQLLEALTYLEGKHIIHRDIKPENILLKDESPNAGLALVDLGFATLEEDYTKLFVRCGTPGYVAPEILADQPYDVKVDVFSVGVIFYIMLCGNVPFPNQSYEKLVNANAECNIDFDLERFGVKISGQGKNEVINSFMRSSQNVTEETS